METRALAASPAAPGDARAAPSAPGSSSRRSPKRRRSLGEESARTGQEPRLSASTSSPRPAALKPRADSKRQKADGDEGKDEAKRSVGAVPALPTASAAGPAVVLSEATTREMDAFVSRCAQWQARLTALSGLLSAQVVRVEREQVASVLRELTARVEVEQREALVRDAEMALFWGEMDRQDAAAFADALVRARGGALEFEAMERQLAEDRVVELETQLQQKRVTEKDKEEELAAQRAMYDRLVLDKAERVPRSELEALARERDALLAKVNDIKLKYRHKAEHLSQLQDEVLNYKFQNAELADECRALREKNEDMARDAERHEGEMAAMRKQLEELQRTRAVEDEDNKWKDDTEKRLEELTAELERARSELSAAEDSGVSAASEIRQLHEAKAELEGELASATVKLDELVQERRLASAAVADDGRSLDAMHADADGSSSYEFGRTETRPRHARSPSAATTPSPSKKRRREDPSPTAVDRLGVANGTSSATESALKRQAVEKDLLQGFFQRYYMVAERKCGDLARQVAELQAQSAEQSQRARESLEALRLCTQAGSLDSAVRVTLLDAVTALERSIS